VRVNRHKVYRPATRTRSYRTSNHLLQLVQGVVASAGGPLRIELRHEQTRTPSQIFPVSSVIVSRVTNAEMRVLVVSNQKGGVGKTTTAISLGAALVENGQRVLIVDLDPQANATSGLGGAKDRAGTYGVLLK